MLKIVSGVPFFSPLFSKLPYFTCVMVTRLFDKDVNNDSRLKHEDKDLAIKDNDLGLQFKDRNQGLSVYRHLSCNKHEIISVNRRC